MRFFAFAKVYCKYSALVFSTFFSAASFAGAFQLWEQNAAGIGDYHAGAAAEADIAATTFYNPAGATRFTRPQVSVGGTLIALEVSYTGTAATIFQVNNAHGDTVNLVPNLQMVYPLSDRWAFSFGVTTPFGLSTDYPDVSFVNLLATKTELQTLNFNPSIAYQLNQYISLALGFDVLYGAARYDSDVFDPLTSHLTGWNDGYNAGILIQFTPHTRAGLSYRSAITVEAKGPSQATSLLTGNPYTLTANAKFPLPATTMLSIYHDINSNFTVMGSAFYTQWSVFKQLILYNLATPAGAGTIALNENYRDTWNFALGGKYHLNSNLALEAGFGHDDTPTRTGYRDIRLPDASHYAVSLGLDITPKPGFYWTMGWTHLFVPTTTIDNSQSNDASQSTVTPNIGIGTTKGSVNVLGIQLSCDL